MTLSPETLNEACPYATHDEIQYLRTEIPPHLRKGSHIVMIGAGPGVLLFPLLESKKAAGWNICVIDIVSVQYAKRHYQLGRPIVQKNAERIEWIEGRDSYDVGMSCDFNVKLLIVDGDHSERGVRRDMEAWLPHMAKDSFVFFHDYDYTGTRWEHDCLPTVKVSVDEVMTGWKQIKRIGCSAVYRRSK